MSALDDWRAFAESVPLRNVFGVEDVEAAVRLGDRMRDELLAEVERVKDEKDCCVDLIRDYEQATEKGMDFASAVTLKSLVGHCEELQQRAEAAEAKRDEARQKLASAETNVQQMAWEIGDLKDHAREVETLVNVLKDENTELRRRIGELEGELYSKEE